VLQPPAESLDLLTGADEPDRDISVADGMPASLEVTPAPPDLLRRVLEGLRRS
jgi:hypothetical protein